MHTQRISTTHSSVLNKIALICCGLTIVLLLFWGINSQIIEPAFQSLEQQQAQDNAERVIAGIESQLSNLTSITNDWASWDDTYQFTKDHNRKYIKSNNLDPALLSRNSNIDLLTIYDKQGVELSHNNFHPEMGKSVIIQSFSGKTPAILALIAPVLRLVPSWKSTTVFSILFILISKNNRRFFCAYPYVLKLPRLVDERALSFSQHLVLSQFAC